MYADPFDKRGSTPWKYSITLDSNVSPVQHGRCRVPIEAKEEIEALLGEMMTKDIIYVQFDPTPGACSLTYSHKAMEPRSMSGSHRPEHSNIVRVPQGLYVWRDNTQASRLNDLAKMHFGAFRSHTRVLLTTFNMHLGRYYFTHIPFGLRMSQDIFQMKMDQIVERYPDICTSMMT